eukprot:COSAG02_NODE_12230_length_1576_cov_10.997292_1_plen_168_part_10
MADEFVIAARDGKVGYVESYVDNEDNDPNVKHSSSGVTALQRASGSANEAEVVGVLLGCDRTDINATDSDGCTALHFAANMDSVECARQLLEGKADVSIKSKENGGETALMLAKRRKSKGVAALIEQHLAAASGGGQKVCLRVCVSVCLCVCLSVCLWGGGGGGYTHT